MWRMFFIYYFLYFYLDKKQQHNNKAIFLAKLLNIKKVKTYYNKFTILRKIAKKEKVAFHNYTLNFLFYNKSTLPLTAVKFNDH